MCGNGIEIPAIFRFWMSVTSSRLVEQKRVPHLVYATNGAHSLQGQGQNRSQTNTQDWVRYDNTFATAPRWQLRFIRSGNIEALGALVQYSNDVSRGFTFPLDCRLAIVVCGEALLSPRDCRKKFDSCRDPSSYETDVEAVMVLRTNAIMDSISVRSRCWWTRYEMSEMFWTFLYSLLSVSNANFEVDSHMIHEGVATSLLICHELRKCCPIRWFTLL